MLPSPERHTPRAHVFQAPQEQPFDVALAETQRLIEEHGHVVVVHPVDLPRAFLHRLHAIRSVLETDRIALMPTSLPPLGTAVLVRQLRQLSMCEFSPGVLGASVRLLAHYVYAGALMHSVTKLDRLPASLTASAKSWNPRAQFAVLAAPTPQLVRTDGGDSGGARSVLSGPQFPTQLTVAHGQSTATWVSGTLAPQWRVADVHEVYLPEESPKWWGTGKLVEFAAAIPDVSVLYRLVSSVRRDECHWCGLELIGDRCAFCAAPAPYGTGARRAGGERPQTARRSPGHAPAQGSGSAAGAAQGAAPAAGAPTAGAPTAGAPAPGAAAAAPPAAPSPSTPPASGSGSDPGPGTAGPGAAGPAAASALRPAAGTGTGAGMPPGPAAPPGAGADPRAGAGPAPGGRGGNGLTGPRTDGPRTDPRRSGSGLAAFLKQKHAAAAAKQAAAARSQAQSPAAEAAQSPAAETQSPAADPQSRHAVVADPRGL
ncbi:hypothetical protein K378_00448 [Streptomyces sp. Amel2xB2]|nr:hypothetical protein K378_00448 [Streptomyces sp. Amel2xB2]